MTVYILTDKAISNQTSKMKDALDAGRIYSTYSAAYTKKAEADATRRAARDEYQKGDKSPDTLFYAFWDGYKVEKLEIEIEDEEPMTRIYAVIDMSDFTASKEEKFEAALQFNRIFNDLEEALDYIEAVIIDGRTGSPAPQTWEDWMVKLDDYIALGLDVPKDYDMAAIRAAYDVAYDVAAKEAICG